MSAWVWALVYIGAAHVAWTVLKCVEALEK